ncbi:MAG: T9SS type A sorting domain-containing protein [Bacteroidales bacterium]|nr:T9SS type A sorting domain-containing protein [Bacteroidales bacterium]
MKSYITLIIGLSLFSSSLCAQTVSDIKFSYDAAGNRTERVIYYESGGQKSAQVTHEEVKEPEFEKGLNVYPNPASNSIFVTLNDDALEEDNRKIILFDNLGKQILQVNALQEVNQVDVSSLTNGTYILKLFYGNRHKEWIIIKN